MLEFSGSVGLPWLPGVKPLAGRPYEKRASGYAQVSAAHGAGASGLMRLATAAQLVEPWGGGCNMPSDRISNVQPQCSNQSQRRHI